MKEGDYPPEDESPSQWALRAERNEERPNVSKQF